MKIKQNLRAGMTFAECDAQRNYMKQAAKSGNCSALNWSPPQTSTPTQLPSYPSICSTPPNCPANQQLAAATTVANTTPIKVELAGKPSGEPHEG